MNSFHVFFSAACLHKHEHENGAKCSFPSIRKKHHFIPSHCRRLHWGYMQALINEHGIDKNFALNQNWFRLQRIICTFTRQNNMTSHKWLRTNKSERENKFVCSPLRAGTTKSIELGIKMESLTYSQWC